MVKRRGELKTGFVSTDIGGVSVVMPTYNAADWLEVTTDKIQDALLRAGFNKSNSEIVIVDDGSKDDTKKVIASLKRKSSIPINYIYQKNSGRYMARKKGVSGAQFAYVWFVDARVHVAEESLKYACSEIRKSSENAVWNAHVDVQKKGNVIARFMDAITYIGWRRYFKRPRRVSYRLEEFDYFPKGTTSFLVPKGIIVDAMEEFEREDHDMQRSSDDTHLIRIIARDHPINLSPRFSCKYHARNTLKAFVKHSFHRGQVFIDGFFRPDTRFFIPIIAFLVVSALGLVVSIAAPITIMYTIGLLAVVWVAEFVGALLLGVALKDALSLFALTPLFAICYGTGLWLAFLKKVKQWLATSKNQKKVFTTLLVMLFFILCTVYFYLGKSALSCSDTMASGPGDQTGLVWLNTMTQGPLWGWSGVSNAPYGENVQSPVHITGVIEYWLFWCFSLFVGPVCGYNLFTTATFIFSAMVVYLFVKSVTRRTDVAVFAGFAATFTPYLQIKTGVHPSYAFYGVFVLAVWLMISLWRNPTRGKALALGLVISSFFFIDPYFILLGGITIFAAASVFIGRLVYLSIKARGHEKEERYVRQKARSFIATSLFAVSVVLICGITPLAITNIVQGDQIKREVSSVRSDIKVEIMTYSARPFEYLLPNPSNPFLGESNISGLGPLQRKEHGSNPAESTLSLSYIVLALSVATVALVIRYSLGGREGKTKSQIPRRFVVAVSVFAVVGFVAFLTSFPTKTHGLIFPSEVISNFIQIWRVYARLAVIVMFSLAIIAAIGLAFMTRRLGNKGRWAISLVVLIAVAFEFLTFKPWDDQRGWSYTQVHPFYSWLKDQNDIKTIAEYPLNEPGMTNVTNAYFRDQYIHRKKVINAYGAASAMAPLRNSLRDLSDPQTVPALAYMGVDLVVVHGEDRKKISSIPGLVEVDWNNSTNDGDSIYVGGQLKAYRVTAPKDSDGLIIGPGGGFSPLARINSTYTEAGYVFDKDALLSVYSLKTGLAVRPEGKHVISLDIASDVSGGQLTVTQMGQMVWQGELSGDVERPASFGVDTSKPISIHSTNNTVILSKLVLN